MKCEYVIKNGELVEAKVIEDYIWIEVIDPTKEEIQYLIDKYNIPEDYLYDVNDPDEVSRVEGLDNDKHNLFILSYPIRKDNTNYITRVVSLIVTNDLVITVRYEDSHVFDDLKYSSFDNLENDGDLENFVIELAWRISKGFVNDIKKINNEIDLVEKKITSTSKTEYLYNIIDIQKTLINFEIAIRGNNPVIKSIFDMENLNNSKFKEELLRDLLVENKQARIMIEKSSLMIDKLSELYSHIIDNNLNTIMKVLTSITIVLTIPTIISGLWGMNVSLPFEKNPLGFLYLVILSIFISGIIVLILKKKDYL